MKNGRANGWCWLYVGRESISQSVGGGMMYGKRFELIFKKKIISHFDYPLSRSSTASQPDRSCVCICMLKSTRLMRKNLILFAELSSIFGAFLAPLYFLDGKTCRKFIFDGTCCFLTYTSSMFSHWNSNFLIFFSLLLLSISSTFPFINFILPSLLVLFFFATCALLPKMNLTRNLCNAKRGGGRRESL